MGKFLESEKQQQAAFKRDAPFFSNSARSNGTYGKEEPKPFCLPAAHADENLFAEFRAEAIEWFNEHAIQWHDGRNGKPSNHLCDAQASCVNALFVFADKPAPLAALLRPLFPGLKQMLPVEDGCFVTFGWMGGRNYLGEKIRPDSSRIRGAPFTCADAVVAFEHDDGRRQSVLIGWKYTEAYHGIHLKTRPMGTDRTKIYQPLFNQADGPLDKTLIPSFAALYFEPFYQFMRLQFLAHGMERARELDADIVSLLNIAPARNQDFRKVTSPELKPLGESATGVWERLTRESHRFQSIGTEALFAPLLANPPDELKTWADYMMQRYRWAVVTTEA
jgi:hypothetical protein